MTAVNSNTTTLHRATADAAEFWSDECVTFGLPDTEYTSAQLWLHPEMPLVSMCRMMETAALAFQSEPRRAVSVTPRPVTVEPCCPTAAA